MGTEQQAEPQRAVYQSGARKARGPLTESGARTCACRTRGIAGAQWAGGLTMAGASPAQNPVQLQQK